jgi:hypothetical protein
MNMELFFDSLIFCVMVAVIVIYTSGLVCICALTLFGLNVARYYLIGLKSGDSGMFRMRSWK